MRLLLVSAVLCFLTACPSSKTMTPDVTPSEKAPESKPASKVEKAPEEKKTLPPCGLEDEACRVQRLGQVTLGWWTGKETPAQIEAELGAPGSKEARVEEEATGDFVELWKWPSRGVELMMTAPNMKVPVTGARDIKVTAPFLGKTDRGIGIGATEAEVREAYADCLDSQSSAGISVIAGSIYGGVFFDITDGKVSGIFVGAGAE